MHADLLTHLGLTFWQARPGYFQSKVAPESTKQPSAVMHTESLPEVSVVSESDGPSAMAGACSPEKDTAQTRLVVVGAGLNAVWQNETSAQWALMLNILKAFQLSEEHLLFLDSAHAVTDEAVFAAIEEVIDLGVERVFAFEEHSALIEQLEEGVQVVGLPSLETMLQQPQAKRQTFEILSRHLSG